MTTLTQFDWTNIAAFLGILASALAVSASYVRYALGRAFVPRHEFLKLDGRMGAIERKLLDLPNADTQIEIVKRVSALENTLGATNQHLRGIAESQDRTERQINLLIRAGLERDRS